MLRFDLTLIVVLLIILVKTRSLSLFWVAWIDENLLNLVELFDKSLIGLSHYSFCLYKGYSRLIVPLQLPHNIGAYDGCTSRDPSKAVDIYIGEFS